MVQLLFARLPQFKDDISSNKQTKDLITNNISEEHSTVISQTIIPLTDEPSTDTNEVNPSQEIRFPNESIKEDSLTSYGWPCVRGLFRFLTQLINNYDKSVHSLSFFFK